jgi:hypothetical protein
MDQPREPATPEASNPAAPAVFETTPPPSPPEAPQADPLTPRGSFFVRHWRGDLPLPVAYWVSSVAFTVAAALAFLPLRVLDVTLHHRLWGLLGIAAWAFFVVGDVWLMVGIWRSAREHPSRGGSRFWAAAARVMTVFAWVALVVNGASRIAPQVGEFASIALGGSEIVESRVRLIRDGAEVEVNGKLGFGIAEELRSTLDANPSVRILHLNSNGGRLAESMAVAKLVREHRLVTYVATECLSACVTAFAAGRERWLSRSAVIGLHEPSFPGMNASEIRTATAEQRTFLLAQGVDAGFVEHGFSTPNTGMWKPSHREILAAHLATGYAPENGVGVSGASARQMDDLGRQLSGVPVYAALKETHPDVHAAVIKAFEEGYRRGNSLDEIRTVTFPLVVEVFSKSLPRASDAAMRRFGELLVAQGHALLREDPRYCASLLDGSLTTAMLNAIPLELRTRELDVQAEVIRSASTAPQRTPTLDEVSPRFPVVLAAMPATARDDISLLDDPKASRMHARRYCVAALSFYEAMLKRPDAEAGPMLRAVLAGGR